MDRLAKQIAVHSPQLKRHSAELRKGLERAEAARRVAMEHENQALEALTELKMESAAATGAQETAASHQPWARLYP